MKAHHHKEFYKKVGAYLIYYYDDKERNKAILDTVDDLDGDGEDDDNQFWTEIATYVD